MAIALPISRKITVFRKRYRHFFFILQKISKKMNYNISIIGRRHEQDLIREYYDSPKALWKRLIVHSFFISNRQCQFGNSYNG